MKKRWFSNQSQPCRLWLVLLLIVFTSNLLAETSCFAQSEEDLLASFYESSTGIYHDVILNQTYASKGPEYLSVDCSKAHQTQSPSMIILADYIFQNRLEKIDIPVSNIDQVSLNQLLKTLLVLSTRNGSDIHEIKASASLNNQSQGTLHLQFFYYMSEQEEEEVKRWASKIVKEIITIGMTDQEKVSAVNKYLATALTYDMSLQQHSAYQAMKTGSTVCDGYAILGYHLLSQAGLLSQTIIGTCEGVDHMWNLIQIDGVWYHTDFTMNDPITGLSDSTYFTEDYLLKNNEQMMKSHQWDLSHFPKSIT